MRPQEFIDKTKALALEHQLEVVLIVRKSPKELGYEWINMLPGQALDYLFVVMKQIRMRFEKDAKEATVGI